MLPDEDDGKVTVAATQVDGMDDFLVVTNSHHYITRSDILSFQGNLEAALADLDSAIELSPEWRTSRQDGSVQGRLLLIRFSRGVPVDTSGQVHDRCKNNPQSD